MAGVGSSSASMIRIPMLIWVCLLFLTCEVRGGHKEALDLKNQLQSIKKNTIKTIQTSGGDVFDCVDIYKQPAFAHPKLKDHKIQLMPTMFLKEKEQLFNVSSSSAAANAEEECPRGSVPILRLERNNMLREKFALDPEPTNPRTAIGPLQTSTGRFKEFWALTRMNPYIKAPWYTCCDEKIDYYGGAATLSIHDVPDVGPDDLSASLIWVLSADAHVILRAGWQVRPDRYNDTKPKLFITWTTDHDKTYCTDTDCPGFVLVSPKPILGVSLGPVSEPSELRVFIYKDQNNGSWWFATGDEKSVIGYWPNEIFSSGFGQADRVDFGGFVGCPSNKKSPPMCSRFLPGATKDGHDLACYVKDVQYYDRSFRPVSATHDQTYRSISDTGCCNVGPYHDDIHGFTFGGPGY